MKAWLKSKAMSIWATLTVAPSLNGPSENGNAAQRSQLALIKQTMLCVLGESGAERFPHLRRRLHSSPNAEDLWFLRVDWLNATASLHGSDEASAQLTQLDSMFLGQLPPTMSPRSSTLSRRRGE